MTDQPAQPPLEVVRVEIAKLALQPGDVLVIKTQNGQGWVAGDDFDTLRALATDNRILILGGDTELSVIHPQSGPADGI